MPHCLYLIFLLLCISTAQALDLRPTVSPWLEDGTNIFQRVQRNVCIGVGPTATDALSLCTAPVASATRALVNLSNTALSAGSASGTYLGANPAVCAGDFFNLQVANTTNAKLTCAGALTVSSINVAPTLTNAHIFVGNVSNVATDVAVSGDLTLINTGAFSIGALKVTNAMLAGSIAASKFIGTDIDTVGTLTAGATGAGFTVALSTSTVTGTLADARLSTNVPLLNAGNIFTAAQTISATGGVSHLLWKDSVSGNTLGVLQARGALGANPTKGDLQLFSATVLTIRFDTGGDVTLGHPGDTYITAIPSISGVRYLCIDTAGKINSQAAACVGT